MFSNELEKLEAIKKLQIDNIDLALASDKKLEILKDKAKELEERLRFLSKSSAELKAQITGRDKKKWSFVIVGMVVFAFISIVLGGTLMSALANLLVDFLTSLLLGALCGYAVYFGVQSFQKKGIHSDIKDQVIDNILSPDLSPPSPKSPIHPSFDSAKKVKVSPVLSRAALKLAKEKYDQSGLPKNSRYR